MRVLEQMARHAGDLRYLGFSNRYEPPDDKFTEVLAATLAATTKVEHAQLDLEGNELGMLCKALLDVVPTSVAVLQMNVGRCEIGSLLDDSPQVLEKLFCRVNLQELELNLSGNYLKDGHLCRISDAIKQSTSLQKLKIDLCNNMIGKQGAQTLHDVIEASGLSRVQVLHDSDLDDDVSTIMEAMNKLKGQ